MRNHDQKIRDMSRSILPSKARRSARSRKAASARRARARSNARLGRLMQFVDDLDGFEDDLGRYDLDDVGWDGMVEDRRSADKVAPLVRWAEARIASDGRLADGDYWTRSSYFSRILGDTLIGRHAHSHLGQLFGEDDPAGRGARWIRVRESAERHRAAQAAERLERARMLAEVLTGAGPRRLNARISALTPPLEEHFAFDLARGGRYSCGTSGYAPWLYLGDGDRWLAADARNGARAIAFAALLEVHAEMYGIAG